MRRISIFCIFLFTIYSNIYSASIKFDGIVIDIQFLENEAELKVKVDEEIIYYKLQFSGHELKIIHDENKEFKSNYSTIRNYSRNNALKSPSIIEHIDNDKENLKKRILTKRHIDDIFINTSFMCCIEDENYKTFFYQFEDGDFIYDTFAIKLNKLNEVILKKKINQGNKEIVGVIPIGDNYFVLILYDYHSDKTIIKKNKF